MESTRVPGITSKPLMKGDPNATESPVPTCQSHSADPLGAVVSKGFRGNITNVIKVGLGKEGPEGGKPPCWAANPYPAAETLQSWLLQERRLIYQALRGKCTESS